MSNQLVKKNPAEGYQNVFPKTFIDAIKDKESGVSLQEILQGFNMYFLSYNGSVALTRCKVPKALRKEGLWITYVLYDHTVVTEWYNSDNIDDESWGSDSNWRKASNALVGDISISTDGYWVINGTTTNIKAQGETGTTPLLRMGDNNKIQVTYDEGKNWEDISDYIVPKFRWNKGIGTTAGTIQISMDLGNTWKDLSNPITNNLRISKYIGINESLPTSGVAEGTIYMKGPYYDENDSLNENPIYRMWVYAWKGNTLAWQDNGEFTSISAGVVQEKGTSTTQVMSQDAVTRELTELESDLRTVKYKPLIPKMGIVWGLDGKLMKINGTTWGASVLVPLDALYLGAGGYSWITDGSMTGYASEIPAVVMFDANKNFLGYLLSVRKANKLDLSEFVEGTKYIGFNSTNANAIIDALKGEQLARVLYEENSSLKAEIESVEGVARKIDAIPDGLEVGIKSLQGTNIVPKMGVAWGYDGNIMTLTGPGYGASILIPIKGLYTEQGGFSWLTGCAITGYPDAIPALVMFDRDKNFLGYLQSVKQANKLDLSELLEGTAYVGFNSSMQGGRIDAYYGEELPSKIYHDISAANAQIERGYSDVCIYSKRTTLTSSAHSETINKPIFKGEKLYLGMWLGNYDLLNAFVDIYGITASGSEVLIVNDAVINRSVVEINVDSDYVGLRIASNSLSQGFVQTYLWTDLVGNEIRIAASDSLDREKRQAHIVCDGVNDEDDLQCAAELSGWVGGISLSHGNFYIDSFPKRGSVNVAYGAIVRNAYVNWAGFDLYIKGVSKTQDANYVAGTKIIVRDSAYDNLPEGVEPCVIGTPLVPRPGKMRIEKICFELETNTKPICVINGQCLGGLIVDSCDIIGGPNAWSNTPPSQGTVGIRGIMGDCDGSDYMLTNTYAIALYEGFQLGGEHLVAYELGTRFCFYGYTFGNYDYGSWYGDNPVTLSHPLTLINCCDEGSRRLPLFAKCGVHYLEGEKCKQQVDLINFNLEIHTNAIVGAEELTEGAFCGNIDFTAYGGSNGGMNTSTGLRHNRVDVKFWKEGSGRGFRTRNMAHEIMGNTATREGYYPTFMQKYFDTDLNKEIICVDEHQRIWKDAMGNVVA